MCCQRYSRSSWLTALLPCPAHACSTMKIAAVLAICLLLATEAACRRTLAGDDITSLKWPSNWTLADWPRKAGPAAAGLTEWFKYGAYCGEKHGCFDLVNMQCWQKRPWNPLDAACRIHDWCLLQARRQGASRCVCDQALGAAAFVAAIQGTAPWAFSP